jgi:flagellar motor switch protein FliN
MPDPENKLPTKTPAQASALLADGEAATEAGVPEEEKRDTRLDLLPMQLDVMVKIRAFHVGDLLALARGSVLETIHDHTQDVPVRCGGVLLMWAEFELVEQKLAVRITRLA